MEILVVALVLTVFLAFGLGRASTEENYFNAINNSFDEGQASILQKVDDFTLRSLAEYNANARKELKHRENITRRDA